MFPEMFKSDCYEDISLGEWMADTPHLLVTQHLQVGTAMIDAIPKDEMVIIPVLASESRRFLGADEQPPPIH